MTQEIREAANIIDPNNSLIRKNWQSLVKSSYVVEWVEGNKAMIKIEPLERGYGLTMGNALRRVMLSSLQGYAIVAIEIDGMEHEYSTLRGVKEDVINIILNLKNVTLRSDSDESRKLKLVAKGPCVVRAGMIQSEHGVEVINPNQIICHLDKGANLDMTLHCSSGKGYMQADNEARVMIGSRDSVSVRTINPGVIPMDAIFSPVSRVSYRVENSRIGANTEFDKLCLEIETNGSITPEMALGLAAKIMLDHFSLLVSFKAGDTGENADVVLPPNVDLRLLIRIGDLDLTVRSSNCLKNYNVIYIGDLITKSEAELMRIPNLGKKSIQELKSLLDRLGMSLAKDIRWPIENAEELSKKFELDIQKIVAGLV